MITLLLIIISLFCLGWILFIVIGVAEGMNWFGWLYIAICLFAFWYYVIR